MKEKCTTKYKQIIENELDVIHHNSLESKLLVYSLVKKGYEYEKYLHNNCINKREFTKFRLSAHWLPIERGRYTKPKTDRLLRVCTLCNKDVGNEFHALISCNSKAMSDIRSNFNTKADLISSQFKHLDSASKFLYILGNYDELLFPHICNWLKEINTCYKSKD